MNSQYRQSGYGLRGLRTYAPAKPGASFETCDDPFCMECLTSPCAKAPKPSAQKPRIRCLLSDQKPRIRSAAEIFSAENVSFLKSIDVLLSLGRVDVCHSILAFREAGRTKRFAAIDKFYGVAA